MKIEVKLNLFNNFSIHGLKSFGWLGCLILLLLVNLVPLQANSGDFGITYEGRIITPNNEPLVANKVEFLLRILETRTNCLLYSEKNSADMSSGDGVFSMTIGKGSRLDDDNNLNLDQVFNPKLTLPKTIQCPEGYTKQAGDQLYLSASFNAGSGPQVLLPLVINASPYAMDTVNVAGISSANVLRVSGNIAAPLDSQSYSYFLSLLNGTASFTSQSLSSRSLTLANPSNSQVMIMPPSGSFTNFTLTLPNSKGNDGEVLSSDGEGRLTWKTPGGGGTITKITAGTGLDGGDITSSGTISLANTGVTPGTFGTSTMVPLLTVDAQGRITAATQHMIPSANSTTAGLLTSDDWSKFNSMLPLTGGTLSGLLILPENGLKVGNDQFVMNQGNVGIGTTIPTAKLHLPAGTASLGGAPLKLTAGTNLSIPETGAIEFDGDSLFYTTAAGVRKTLGVSGSGITALTGEVSASGNGSVSATVNSVGGSSAAAINTAVVAVNTEATSASTANTLVKRNATGAASFRSVIINNGSGNSVTLESPDTLASYSLKWPQAVAGTPNSVLTSATDGQLSWSTLSTIGGQINLSSQVSGVLAIANGGTNSSAPLNNNQLMVSTSGAIKELGAMTDGQIIVGQSSAPPQIVTVSGDVTINNTGATTVAKIGGTAVSGVGLASNNLLQNASGAAIPANNILLSNATGTGVTALNSPASGLLTSTGGLPSWTSLTSDLFSQYALLAGRTGGQTFYGGTAANDNLTLQSTAHSTQGHILLAPSGGNVAIGTTNPTALIHLKAGSTTAGSAPLKFSSGSLMTTPENGAVEFDGSNLYLTTSGNRRALASGGSVGTLDSIVNINNSSGGINLTPSPGNSVTINNSTASFSPSTGALIVNGGAGIGGNLNVAGAINSGSTISATTSMTSPIIYGSNAPSGTLTLESTSDLTKGNVFIAPAGGGVAIGSNTMAIGSTDLLYVAQKTPASGSVSGLRVETVPTTAGTPNRLNGAVTYAFSTDAANPTEYTLGIDARGVANNTSTTAVETTGGAFSAYLNAIGGNITNAYGLRANAGVYSSSITSGNIGTAASIYAQAPNTRGGGATITNAYSLLLDSPTTGTNNFSIYQNGGGKNYFSGSVGIGTNNPSSSLEIMNSSGNVLSLYRNINTANWGVGTFYKLNDSAGLPTTYASVGASISDNTAGAPKGFLSFQVADGSATWGNAYQQEKMRILWNGNVGIGTTSPSTTLEINGSGGAGVLRATTNTVNTNTAQNVAYLRAVTSGTMADGFGSQLLFASTDSSATTNNIGSLSFVRDGANNSSKMTLTTYNAGAASTGLVMDRFGKVGIGTTTPTSANLVVVGEGSVANPASIDVTPNASGSGGDAKLTVSQQPGAGDLTL